MSLALSQPADDVALRPHNRKKWIAAAVYSFIFITMLYTSSWGLSWRCALSLFTATCCLFVIAAELRPLAFACLLSRLYISRRKFEVIDHAVQKRARSRYFNETKELDSIGFTPLFVMGDDVSIFSFLLIYPALIHLTMRAHGEILVRSGNTRISQLEPVLINKDRSAYAVVFGLGVIFRTKLTDGTVIASGNFGDSYAEGKIVRFSYKGASIATTWNGHLETIAAYERVGNPVCMEVGFEHYLRLLDCR